MNFRDPKPSDPSTLVLTQPPQSTHPGGNLLHALPALLKWSGISWRYRRLLLLSGQRRFLRSSRRLLRSFPGLRKTWDWTRMTDRTTNDRTAYDCTTTDRTTNDRRATDRRTTDRMTSSHTMMDCTMMMFPSMVIHLTQRKRIVPTTDPTTND